MKTNTNKGFTLIELLVVIAIIGLLATVVMTSLNQARKKGRDARRVADIDAIRSALELYYDAHGSYPSTASGTAVLVPDYMSVVPTDPNTQQAYTYESDGKTYVLAATLESDTHKALQSDYDDSIDLDNDGTKVNCADPVYCVMP